MDEFFWIIVAMAVIFAPVVLSIVAMVKANRTAQEVATLRAMIARVAQRTETVSAPALAVKPPVPAPRPVRVPVAVPPPMPASAPPAAAPSAPRIAPSSMPPHAPPVDHGLELALGGKAASFVGAAAVLIAIALFVGYAIQHGWIGPAARVILGLIAGGVLVAIGHLVETRGRNLHILAQAVTGAGVGLFYFSVFAAYGIYHLVGEAVTAAGLAGSAAAALALAARYRSEAVAVLGLTGAFLAPLLIHGDFSRGLFPLAYIGAVNLPVIIMGARRNWQVMASLAFCFTMAFFAAWLEREVAQDAARWWFTGALFSTVYFAEFAALGLLKDRAGRSAMHCQVDVWRVVLNGLVWLGALHWILGTAGHQAWRGEIYVMAALIHAVLARLSYQRRDAFEEEALAFASGAVFFATMALPAQCDGVWVSLGWGVEGALLAWLGLRLHAPVFQIGAVVVALLGFGKVALYDHTLYAQAPRLFLNGRFAVALLSAALLGVQGRLHERLRRAGRDDSDFSSVLWCLCVLGLAGAVFADVFFVLSRDDPWAWMLTTLALLVVGLGAALVASRGSDVVVLAFFLLGLIPVKLALADLHLSWDVYGATHAFRSGIFWLRLGVLAAAAVSGAYAARKLARNEPTPWPAAAILNLLSIAIGLVVVTIEIDRSHSRWASSMITLWWAVSAFALVGVGLIRARAHLRYCGLVLFGLTVAKVFLVDLSGLEGLPRIAAFLGVGVLLLVLSAAYQKIAPAVLSRTQSESV